MKIPDTKAELELAKDAEFRELLSHYMVASAPMSLDRRVLDSYEKLRIELQSSEKAALISLRKIVAFVLMGVFSFNVCLTGTIIILVGLGRIKLAPEIIYILMTATIVNAVVLYRRVVDYAFGGVQGFPIHQRDWPKPTERYNQIPMTLPPFVSIQAS
jgi:hypothetical protein